MRLPDFLQFAGNGCLWDGGLYLSWSSLSERQGRHVVGSGGYFESRVAS